MKVLLGNIFWAWDQRYFLRQIGGIALVFLLSGFAQTPMAQIETSDVGEKNIKLLGNPDQHKNIFIFFDGTLNDQKSSTNVWNLYNLIAGNNDPQTTEVYIKGVGTTDNPVLGAALGKGMEERILTGYKFIIENYHPGDNIYIFGFSRGAHEARSLAGLLALAGYPILSAENKNKLMDIGNTILDFSKDKSDEDADYRNALKSSVPGQPPVLAKEIKEELDLDMLPVEITFLGVWDTVPGSSFKNYGACKEEKGFVKTYFSWLPGISAGERYKTDSYPAIHYIVHAVSLDEKRSKFKPILLCPPINAQATETTEVWFPGAHADVGGGYEDSHELQDISLSWMIDQLANKGKYKFNPRPPKIEGVAEGLAHWSIKDFPANTGSECVDREPPPAATLHPSIDKRKRSSPVPIRVNGVVKRLGYPLNCADLQ
ncbi:phospholipase effector Tle1 domain-containing protein [Methylomonas albis]|uniref:DUF2235 domain-containing protein n=1 Tax=Methylomonas albis TaxID=1854563 RepID=A0ABR9CWD1_9GAMM|nr:DUF2235 domain-containing protein [Methylomonas albis]MBD9355183.1 DUF2235 domain-containing protein [Methylomonas albis]